MSDELTRLLTETLRSREPAQTPTRLSTSSAPTGV